MWLYVNCLIFISKLRQEGQSQRSLRMFMNYQQLAEKKRKEAQEVLQKLETGELDRKLQRHEALQKEIKILEGELATLLGVDFGAERAGGLKFAKSQRKKSLGDEQKSERS
jgi:hypothetical protein